MPVKQLRLPVVSGEVMGIPVYRGFARISDLSRISQPDVYDQEKNPTGTQRDLNRRHAREAYEYVTGREVAFFPEIVLHARDDTVLEFTPSDDDMALGNLAISETEIAKRGGIILSRVDGNHRLFYADGHDPKFPPLDRFVGFCIIHSLPTQEVDKETGELVLFRDINANQQGMNTSHLDSIALRATEAGLEIRDPVLHIAERLMEDDTSPFKGRIYRGGVKPAGFTIALRNLRTSVEYMRQRSKRLSQLNFMAQTRLIERYWHAVRRWIPHAWDNPGKYIILRGAGFWAMSFIGADVIDRAVTAGRVETDDMLAILKSGKEWDWTNAGDFRGYGGRKGAVEISNIVTKEFATEGASISEIEAKLI